MRKKYFAVTKSFNRERVTISPAGAMDLLRWQPFTIQEIIESLRKDNSVTAISATVWPKRLQSTDFWAHDRAGAWSVEIDDKPVAEATNKEEVLRILRSFLRRHKQDIEELIEEAEEELEYMERKLQRFRQKVLTT